MRSGPVPEVAITFVAVTLATLLVTSAGRALPIDEYVHLIVGALFLWSAVHMSQRQPAGLARYGLSLGGLLEPPEHAPAGFSAALLDLAAALGRTVPLAMRELGVALATAAVVFPAFALGFRLFHAPAHPFDLHLPEQLPSYLLTQLLVVGIPEEALFRGYFQGRLSERFQARTRLLGARLSLPALIGQALLFGLIHFAVDSNPARLAVFFPALLFGWLRELRGGIGAAAAFHALCNLFSDVLVRSWL
jgi:membrane protease YdiL (CAAX protease family)